MEGKPRRALPGEPLQYLENVVLPFTSDECLIWPFAQNGVGYGRILFDGVFQSVTRLVCERTHGESPSPEHQAAHTCGKGHTGCCNPGHLTWKTPVANNGDKLEHGTLVHGERHHATKLTERQVAQIRSLRGVKLQREIAAEFGIARNTVSAIQTGTNWRRIDAY